MPNSKPNIFDLINKFIDPKREDVSLANLRKAIKSGIFTRDDLAGILLMVSSYPVVMAQLREASKVIAAQNTMIASYEGTAKKVAEAADAAMSKGGKPVKVRKAKETKPA